jgi:23S rRNA pseudouridine1911/1915/1917 synthase
MNIPVVYEDDWLLVVNKPSGLLVIPTPKRERRTLTGILNEEMAARQSQGRLYPCHRLDRETSGLIICAKGKSVQRELMRAFKAREVKKTYTAFVQGTLSRDQGRISYPIEGASSVTDYQVLERRKDFSIVKVWPLTGRTNQIRIHFKKIGHPIVGESKFAYRRDYRLKAKRTCLHAGMLEFAHPVTKKGVRIECELSGDLKDFLRNHPS